MFKTDAVERVHRENIQTARIGCLRLLMNTVDVTFLGRRAVGWFLELAFQCRVDQPNAPRYGKFSGSHPALAIGCSSMRKDVHALHAPEELEIKQSKDRLADAGIEQNEPLYSHLVWTIPKAPGVHGIENDVEAGLWRIGHAQQLRLQGDQGAARRFRRIWDRLFQHWGFNPPSRQSLGLTRTISCARLTNDYHNWWRGWRRGPAAAERARRAGARGGRLWIGMEYCPPECAPRTGQIFAYDLTGSGLSEGEGRCRDATAATVWILKRQVVAERDGSVCLNTSRGVSKWVGRSFRQPPGLASPD